MTPKTLYSISLESQPAAEDVAAIRLGLIAFDNQHAPVYNDQQLTVFLRDEDNSLVGGLLGETSWGWLYVKTLWLNETARGQGHGSRLLALAEEEAIARGCRHAHLDTLSFQALPFYEGHGYRVFGRLNDFPAGHTLYFLTKELIATA